VGVEYSSSGRMPLQPVRLRPSSGAIAPGRAGRAKRKIVRYAAKQFVDDGWLPLTLFGVALFVLILQG
jgi:hypothetical protein